MVLKFSNKYGSTEHLEENKNTTKNAKYLFFRLFRK